MAVTRFGPTGARKRPAFISFRNVRIIANRIILNSATARRSSISKTRMARVMSAMLLRRIQPTNTTEYSINFDTVVSSMNAIVPPTMNLVIKGVPIAGNLPSGSDIIKVHATGRDTAEVYSYVKSKLFVLDLDVIKAFAQAQSIAMVQLNPFEPFIMPSITLRVDSCLADNDLSVVKDLRFQTETVDNATRDPDQVIAKLSDDNPDIEEIAIKGESSNIPTIAAVPDMLGKVLIEANPDESVANMPENIAYHINKNDDSIHTLSEAYGVMAPIYIISDDVLTTDHLDTVIQSKGAVTFESDLEERYFVESAVTLLYRDFAAIANKERELPAAAGLVGNRSGFEQRVPAEGVGSPIDSPLKKGEVSQQQGYNVDQGLSVSGNAPAKPQKSGPRRTRDGVRTGATQSQNPKKAFANNKSPNAAPSKILDE